jgi:hypothetical protein
MGILPMFEPHQILRPATIPETSTLSPQFRAARNAAKIAAQ